MHPAVSLLVLTVLSVALAAQDKPQPAPQQRNLALVSPSARLAAAKTAYMKNAGGSDIPFNVISGAVESWGRFQMVNSPSEADVVIAVSSPDDDRPADSSKTHVAGGAGGGGSMKEPAPASSNTDGPIRVVVSDAHTNLALWSATEQPKGGFRQRVHDQHVVEAAERLVTRLHERLEGPAKP